MNSLFSEQILEEKLSKLNSTQQCIETLSHWCIFHRAKAELVVATWAKQFHVSDISQKVPLMYLANDILQNSKRKGDEFINEFWKVLPTSLKEVVDKGDDRGRNTVSRLVAIWEERKVFGSHSQGLKAAMLGEVLPQPLELLKKRSRPVKIIKRDSRSIRTKLSIGGMPEKIVSAFNSVFSLHTSENDGTTKCKSAVQRVKKMEKDVELALMKVNDPSRKTLTKGLQMEETILKESIDKLKIVEANRVALVSQLRDALKEQESELEILRTQIQVAQAQIEEAANMRKQLEGDYVNANGSTKKTAAAIAAEVADKLAASSSSQYIMTSVLSTFAAEEAKNAGLTTTPTSTPSFQLNPNSPYQQVAVPHPLMQAQIPNSQANYHPPNVHYIQPPGSYDYANAGAFPMAPLIQQPLQMPQQPQHMPPLAQPLPGGASFRHTAPLPGPGLVYYIHHPYQSQ